MNLRDLSRGLVDYISDQSDNFTRDEAQAFRVVLKRIMYETKVYTDLDEATALRVLRDLN
jgi:hypothetical protein